jgi:uncharacterized membrane protein
MRVWLVVHVLSAIGGIGPEFAFGIMGPRARKRDRATALAVYRAIDEARKRVVYPALVLQIASGIALIVVGRHSILEETWLAVALALYLVAIVVVVVMLAPGSALARQALADGIDPADPSLRGLWARQAVAGAVAGTLLIVVAVLMVLKPGG